MCCDSRLREVMCCDSRLGLWSIEASYSGDFTTAARTDFEVKEYGKILAALLFLFGFLEVIHLLHQFYPAFPSW